MKRKFVRCESCKSEVSTNSCELATYREVINDMEFTFCCIKCAQQYKQKTEK